MNLSKAIFAIWIKLHYYSVKILSKLASFVGISLYTDKQTASQFRLSSTKICVEVDIHSSLPAAIPFIVEDGTKAFQEVLCEWIPPKCTSCRKFGHNTPNCPSKPKQTSIWVPKKLVPAVEEPKDVDIAPDLVVDATHNSIDIFTLVIDDAASLPTTEYNYGECDLGNHTRK
ncbi:hypothetical protein ACH5RR_032136 [Cinchona calisaya]|uniref:DUF4283 domain-containing protein n=1 Tax=Cinchona calisaya TaxID=153742 RepID=A0ABD2YLB6_9GENT